jgi:hypothetical protein
MAVAGSFLGWQPAAVAVLASALLAVVAALIRRKKPAGSPRSLAPYLAAGIVVAWLGWPWLGPCLYPILFDGLRVGVLVLVVPVILVCLGSRPMPLTRLGRRLALPDRRESKRPRPSRLP